MDRYTRIRGGSAYWTERDLVENIFVTEFFGTSLANKFWIKVSGVWKECITWIKVNGVWKQASPKIKQGTWR